MRFPSHTTDKVLFKELEFLSSIISDLLIKSPLPLSRRVVLDVGFLLQILFIFGKDCRFGYTCDIQKLSCMASKLRMKTIPKPADRDWHESW